MFDGCADTCWNSDQGSPQYVVIDFGRPVAPTALSIMFQGGFAGVDGAVEIGLALDAMILLQALPDVADSNALQMFALQRGGETDAGRSEGPDHQRDDVKEGRYMRISFPASTDFYGRVTVYQLDVYGYEGATSQLEGNGGVTTFG